VDGKCLLSCGGDKTLVLSSVNGRVINKDKAVAVPYGTIYDLDVDASNKYLVTSGQDKRVNIWQVRRRRTGGDCSSSSSSGSFNSNDHK